MIYIENEHLLLVRYTREDHEDMYRCWQDKQTQRGYNSLFSESYEAFSNQKIERFPFWAVAQDKHTSEKVGVVRLTPPPYEDPDLALWIYPNHRKKGYGAAVFSLGVRYCFEALNLPVINAGAYEDNNASRRILEKLGFIRDPERDIEEVSAFTGESILQWNYQITPGQFYGENRPDASDETKCTGCTE